MEQFDDRNVNRIKEKNVYLLHLDAPRIIIISCVLVGVLIVAFLIGMNLSSDGSRDTATVAQREMLFNPIPDEPGQHTELPSMDAPGEQEGAAPGGNAALPQKDGAKQAAGEIPGNAIASNKSAAVEPPDKETKDILTQDNIKEIIPPSNAVKKDKKERVAAQPGNARRNQPARKEIRQKSHRTVEVASKTERTERAGRAGYSIQVSAYDNRATAQREMAKLKEHRYDPYIENTRVEGKRFYRVRIGPISSRKEAVKLLEEIQEMNRYGNSYITRD